jgi:hypothetical protein
MCGVVEQQHRKRSEARDSIQKLTRLIARRSVITSQQPVAATCRGVDLM